MRQAYDYWQDQPGNYRRQRIGSLGLSDKVAAKSQVPLGDRTDSSIFFSLAVRGPAVNQQDFQSVRVVEKRSN